MIIKKKKEINKRKKIKKKKIVNESYFNIVIFIFFILSYYLFFLSLEQCYEGVDICCKKFRWIKVKLVEESISCIITIILFELIILKKGSKLHLIHFISVYIFFYKYSHGIDFDDHGYYNIKYFFIIVIFVLLVLFITKYLLFLKNKKYIILFAEIFLVVLYLFRKVINNSTTCDGWEKGLNNTSIDNNINKYKCLIKIPKYCPYKIGRFFLDVNRLSPLDCNVSAADSRKKMLKHSKSPFINENTTHIGYPLTNKEEELFLDINFNKYQNFIFDHLIDMDNLTLLNLLGDKKPEVSLDYTKTNYGKININLNFNKSLSEKRKKLENLTNPFSNNIIIFYLDSVSRAYSIRQLKKTLSFFENFISYKGNSNTAFPTENFHSFQFFKYYSHKYFTTGNYPILFYGNHRNKNNKYITLYLKKNGYVTSYTSDFCYIDFIRTFHDFSFEDVHDHHFTFCDPSYWGPIPKVQCFYGKSHIEYMLEYTKQFWIKYKDNRKFSMFLTNFAHEGSLEKLKYIDNLIYEFFNNLFNDNYFKETSIFLLSDHGVAIPSIYFLNDFFKYEKILPMLYLIVNDRKNVTYEQQYKFLHKNQQTFITGFDIYNTIVHLIYGEKYGTEESDKAFSKYGKSLFTEINPMDRSPKGYSSMEDYGCK